MGRPPYLTPEQREESRIRQNRRRSKRSAEKKRLANAAKALAEGRIPGTRGPMRRLSEEERLEARRESVRKWRAANLEAARISDAERHRLKVAKRAIAAGREPGRIGAVPKYTPEQRVELARARSISYWERNPDRRVQAARRYYDDHREEARVKVAVRRTRKAGNGGKFTPWDIARIHEAQHGICLFCGELLGEAKPQIDHWIPVVEGGSSDPNNLALLHAKCNKRKAAKMPSHFGLPNDVLELRAATTPAPLEK